MKSHNRMKQERITDKYLHERFERIIAVFLVQITGIRIMISSGILDTGEIPTGPGHATAGIIEAGNTPEQKKGKISGKETIKKDYPQ